MSKGLYAAIIAGSMVVGGILWESAQAIYHALSPEPVKIEKTEPDKTVRKFYESDNLLMRMGYDSESTADMFDRVIFSRERMGERASDADIGGIAVACDRDGDGTITGKELKPWLTAVRKRLEKKYGAPEVEYAGPDSETKKSAEKEKADYTPAPSPEKTDKSDDKSSKEAEKEDPKPGK